MLIRCILPVVILLSQLTSALRASEGELAPHFKGDLAEYVGTFHGNHAYILKTEDGKLGTKLSDKKYAADVVSAREKLFIIVKHSSKNEYSIVDPYSTEAKTMKFSDLDFKALPDDHIIVNAWKKALNSSDPSAGRLKGKVQEWIDAGVTAQEKETKRFYVGTEIQSEPKSSTQFVPILTVTQERFTIILDPNKNQYTATLTDVFAIPIGESKERELTKDSMAYAVLERLKASLRD